MTPDADAAQILIELVFSPATGETRCLSLRMPAGSTVAAALRLARARPEDAVPDGQTVGIFGQPVAETTVLRAGDRLELYRPLLIDPKDARRHRAARASKG